LTAKILLGGLVRRPVLRGTIVLVEPVERISFWEFIGNWWFVFYRAFFGWWGTVKLFAGINWG